MTDTHQGLSTRTASALTRNDVPPLRTHQEIPGTRQQLPRLSAVHIVDPPGAGLKALGRYAVELRSSLDPDAHQVMPATARPPRNRTRATLDRPRSYRDDLQR